MTPTKIFLIGIAVSIALTIVLYYMKVSKIYLGVFFSFALFVTSLITLLYGKDEDSSSNDAPLDKLTKEMYQVMERLSRAQCQDQASTDDMTQIATIRGQADVLIKNTAEAPSPSAVSAFNSAVEAANAVIQKVLALPKCKDPNCPQGDFTTEKGCTCPPDYPYAILGEGLKIYCYNRKCQDPTHGKFIPDSGADPSKNACVCDPGYAFDANDAANGNCYNVANTSALQDLTSSMGKYVTDLEQYLG